TPATWATSLMFGLRGLDGDTDVIFVSFSSRGPITSSLAPVRSRCARVDFGGGCPVPMTTYAMERRGGASRPHRGTHDRRSPCRSSAHSLDTARGSALLPSHLGVSRRTVTPPGRFGAIRVQQRSAGSVGRTKVRTNLD